MPLLPLEAPAGIQFDYTSGASGAGLDVANGVYTIDAINGTVLIKDLLAAKVLADALLLQVGGATVTTFNFTNDQVLADNDSVYDALDKLDTKWFDLASVANLEGAALVGIEDVADDYVATDVEAALAELGPLNVDSLQEAGTVQVARLGITTAPSSGDTVTIGADVYEFLPAATPISVDSNIGVLIGTAAASRTNLINAINGAGTGIANGLQDTLGGELDLENGTEPVLAALVDTVFVAVYSADAPGGPKRPSAASRVVDEALTAVGVGEEWDIGATADMNSAGARGPAKRRHAYTAVTVTAAMITALGVRVALPFTPTMFTTEVRRSGIPYTGSDATMSTNAFTISGDDILIVLDGTATNISASDVVTIHAWE